MLRKFKEDRIAVQTIIYERIYFKSQISKN